MNTTKVNEQLLGQIDNLQLSERILRWKAAMKAAPWRLYAEREKYTVQSWKATEGEDIQLRKRSCLSTLWKTSKSPSTTMIS